MTMAEVKKYTINFLGQSHTIVSDEPEEIMVAAIARCEERTRALQHMVGSSQEVHKIALLAVLEASRDVARVQHQLDEVLAAQARALSLIDQEIDSL